MQSQVWNPDLVRVGTLEEEAREECFVRRSRNLEEASHATMRKKEREKEKRKKRKRKKKKESLFVVTFCFPDIEEQDS